MTIQNLKKTIDKSGVAYATLFNNYGENYFLGNVQKMNSRKGRLHLSWKMPNKEHTSAFTGYMIHNEKDVLYAEDIVPLRADANLKKFDVEFDL